jgi:hypothetical protein
MHFTAAQVPLEEVNADLAAIRAGLRQAGVPANLIRAIGTRALLTGRKLTGAWQTNREPRWQVQPEHPQFGTEWDCKVINIRLLAMVLEFTNALAVDEQTAALAAKYLGRPLEGGAYRDALTLEKIDYQDILAEAGAPVHGSSRIHIGHENPTLQPKHVPDNVSWRIERSNLIQGDMTLPQARAWIIRLIARYFDLGEVNI